MTSEQIDYMSQSGLLFLDHKRRKRHFEAAHTFRLLAFMPVVLFFVFLIKEGTGKLGMLAIFCTVVALLFLLVSYLIYQGQQRKLKLVHFDTGLPQSENYTLAKKTLEALQWTVGHDSPNFIEAYNPHRDIRTWGNEMASIVLRDNQVLLNSICNLDLMNQIMFTFGKNEQNIDKFMDTFKHLAQNKEQQSA